MADPVSFTIMMVVQIGIGFLFPSEGPRLKDLKISASTYGVSIPDVFGHARVPGNMIWSDKIREHKHKKMVGKGGFYNEYKYTCTFAMGLCKGPISRVLRMWANGKLFYDATENSQIPFDDKYRFRLYSGSEQQVPDASIVSFLGESNTPAFRGLAYVVFDNLPLDDFGNQIPQITVEVFASGEVAAEARGPNVVGTDPALPNYQSDTLLVDPVRGCMYVISISPTIPFGQGGFIRRFRLSDGVEDFNTNDGQGVKNAEQLVGVSPTTGAVIAFEGVANSVPIFALEPVGLTEVARLGEFSSGFAGVQLGLGRGAFSVVSDGTSTIEYMIYSSLFGHYEVLKTALNGVTVLKDYVEGIGFTRAGANRGGVVFAGQDRADHPIFWAWEGGDASAGYVPSLQLKRFVSTDFGTTWTGTIIYERPNPIADVGGNQIGFNVYNIFFDETDGGLILSWNEDNRGQIGKFDLVTNSFRWSKDVEGRGLPQNLQPMRPTNGKLMWINAFGTLLYAINTVTGDWISDIYDPYDSFEDTKEIPVDLLLPPTNAQYTGVPVIDGFTGGEAFYDAKRESVVSVGGGGKIGKVQRPIFGSGNTTLAAVVEGILRRAGLGAQYFDLSRLESTTIRGYGWASGTDVKSILDQLRAVFLFDIIESNGKLVGVMRDDASNTDAPGVPVRRVQQKVLGSTADDAMDFWQETRIQEADLPARVSLAYMNWDDDFQTSTAVSRRMLDPVPTMFSRQQVAMEINILMTGTEAKNQVNKMLWAQWGERTKHNTRLPWAYVDLDPADVITVTMDDGRNYEERIHTLELGADFGIASETYSRDSGAYLSDQVGDAGGGGGGGAGPISPTQAARAFVLNTPLLRDSDDTAGSYSLYYSGLGNIGTVNWKGGSLHRSRDNIDYSLLYGTDGEVEWGNVAGVVPPPQRGDFALDWETRITIWPNPLWFELESITDDELWAGQNLCMVGQEVMQFRDAVQNANGSWTIWNLLRGRRGTEYAASNHVLGEPFIFLSTSTIQGEGETLDARGQDRFFKGVGQGRSVLEASPIKIVYEPRDLMPYAPKDIRRAISGTSITVTWKRRTRMGGNMLDGTGDVPLHEASESYEVYILSAPFTGDLSRGNTVPEDSILFQAVTTAPNLTVDVSGFPTAFDVNLDSLHVLVYQISATVGRGFPGARSIEPWRTF